MKAIRNSRNTNGKYQAGHSNVEIDEAGKTETYHEISYTLG